MRPVYESGWRRWTIRAGQLVLVLLVALHAPGVAFGQASIRNVTQPIPVVNTGGHSAPVRSLVFAPPDGAQLLSAGFDKIINVWSLREDPPALSRTIRPRIWRGYAGAIFAIALATRPEADGQRLLAVGGFGVDTSHGEIGLFRYPGANNASTGDIVAELPGGAANGGHAGTVTSLAFDPRGRYLASAGQDRTVRIWDLTTRKTVAVLPGHTQPVNAVAYLPGGRLVAAGADGLVRLWDVDRRANIATAAPDPRRQRRDDPARDAINALAVSNDGRWVVIGRENGDVVRYDGATLRNPLILPLGDEGRGAVEAVAISRDGRSLATSVVSFGLKSPGERPRVECDVELRRMTDGAIIARIARTSNLVYACAFSLDDKQLAFAGGDSQAITITDLTTPPRTSAVLAGQGSSLWDVGFAADSLAFGFARSRPDLPAPPETYEDFDLRLKRVVPFGQAELTRALTTWNGWTVRPVDPYTLDVLDAAQRGYRVKLDPVLDRRWWSFSFIPPGPSHPRPTLAIGCESGVLIYGLDDGGLRRLYAGHHGPVYALAPSPDGRWLVTGSSDQTARLWRLADCDTLAPLGVQFAPGGPGAAATKPRPKVEVVERFGFAESMGMQVGDEVEKFYIAGKEQSDLKALDAVRPNTVVEFVVQRGGKPVELSTTKRDSPALTLFPALDREWILWTPQGYYETSAIGDRRYLGWHRNRVAIASPTDFFSFDHYEQELRRPDALLRFLQTADRGALAAAVLPVPPAVPAPAPAPPPAIARGPEQVIAEDVLPQVAILAPLRPAFSPLLIPSGNLPISIRAATEDAVAGRGLIRNLRVQVDGGKADEVAVAPPLAIVNRVVTVNFAPGRHRVSVTAMNDRSQERTESFDLIAQEPPKAAPAPAAVPATLPPQLIVLALGAGSFDGPGPTIPPIAFAGEDGRDLAAFLSAPLGMPRYTRVETRAHVGEQATAEKIAEAFQDLDARRSRGDLGPGDSVFVIVESHLVRFQPGAVILGNDAHGQPPGPSIQAATIADCLGQLADYGCKVMLIVDAMHETRPDPDQTQRDLIEWTRSLYRKNVITFVASNHGPSQRLAARAHGAFAQGILDVLNVRGQARLANGAPVGLTLSEFQDVVGRNVLALTNRHQHARCYIPDTIPGKVPILDPPARRATREPLPANE